MKQLHIFSLSALIAMAATPAIGQQAAPTQMPAMTASMPMDCGKTPIKRHDHAAERGLGGGTALMPMAAPCGPDAAASATASKAKKKLLRHDHTATKNN